MQRSRNKEYSPEKKDQTTAVSCYHHHSHSNSPFYSRSHSFSLSPMSDDAPWRQTWVRFWVRGYGWQRRKSQRKISKESLTTLTNSFWRTSSGFSLITLAAADPIVAKSADKPRLEARRYLRTKCNWDKLFFHYRHVEGKFFFLSDLKAQELQLQELSTDFICNSFLVQI